MITKQSFSTLVQEPVRKTTYATRLDLEPHACFVTEMFTLLLGHGEGLPAKLLEVKEVDVEVEVT